MAVIHAVTQAVEICQQDGGLFIRQGNDRIVVQRDTAADTVVVRWQQILQELIVGGKPLYLKVRVSRKVLHPVRHRNNHKIIPSDVVTLFVEHKTPFARRTQQVHAGVAQLFRVNRVEVSGKDEVNLRHVSKIQQKAYLCKL